MSWAPSHRWAAWQARIGDAAIARAIRAWGGDPASAEPLAAGINRVVGFRAAAGPAVLRLVHAELRGAAAVRAALRYQQHLAEAGAPVPAPLPAADGRPVQLIDLGPDRGRAVASAQTRLGGRPLTEPLSTDDAAPERVAAWGAALGALHAAAASYRPPGRLRYPELSEQWRRVAPALADRDPELAAAHADLTPTLERLRRDPELAAGLCHADARAGNALLGADGEVAWVDFDEPTRAPFAYDVARAALAWADRPPADRARLLRAFATGYAAAPGAPRLALEAVPALLRIRCTLMAGWTLSSGPPHSESAGAWHAWVRGHALEPG